MLIKQNQVWLILFSLLMLRVVIGLHFFSEGLTKVQSGNFSCQPFLSQAKGPMAPWFHSLIDDYDGHLRLCINEDNEIDTQLTFAIWEQYVTDVAAETGFSPEQQKLADQVLSNSRDWLSGFLAQNEPEILAWVAGEGRLEGFERDGELKQEASSQVASLYDQVNTIKSDRARAAGPWLAEVETTWDELEARINVIAERSSPQDQVTLPRPYREKWSKQDLIDRFLPWFDLTVGILLFLGLFTRFAAMAGAGLLLGVVATQPFWVAGTQNTFYQWIELAGLLVLFATAAGQFWGLDYLFRRRSNATVVSD